MSEPKAAELETRLGASPPESGHGQIVFGIDSGFAIEGKAHSHEISAKAPWIRYNRCVEFEWDANKAADNLRKHKVSFMEAATVFGDFLGITVPDPAHSADEDRYITVGLSNLGRLLMVAHTERDERIRIISARTLTAKEKRAYENSEE